MINNNVAERTNESLINDPDVIGKMGRRNCLPLPLDILYLPDQEINNLLGGLDDYKAVVRSLIMLEVYLIRSGVDRPQRTARFIWYDHVKPVISKLGILYNKTKDNNDVNWPTITEQVLTDLVKIGLTSYEELQVYDTSRKKVIAREIPTRMINVNMVGGDYPEVILYVEKDTVWPVIDQLASLYGLSAISGHGQPSNACTENTIREIIRSDVFQVREPEYISILSMTDYDPAGFSISNAQLDQIKYAIKNMPSHEKGNLKNGDEGVTVNRLGLYPHQLTQEQIEAKKYQPAEKGLDEWFNEHGGINGEPMGLELDSLNFEDMRSIMAREIEKTIDIWDRYWDLRTAFIELMACYELLPDFEKRRDELIRAAEADPVWDEIRAVQLPKDLFFNAAKAGAGWIGPQQTLDLFEPYQDRLTALWEADQ